MLTHDQPATTPAVRRRPAGRVRTLLLTAGIGLPCSTSWATIWWPQCSGPTTSPVDQAISELTSPSAP